MGSIFNIKEFSALLSPVRYFFIFKENSVECGNQVNVWKEDDRKKQGRRSAKDAEGARFLIMVLLRICSASMVMIAFRCEISAKKTASRIALSAITLVAKKKSGML